ncbi:hypothetical protein TVAG_226800 [Trichomonas vaginalis G3]|uniref:DnaK protein n=1 Tax=Trichomonas vaginalis (strain ATCC PRA-98 / G3) TaxID=412133 RepID=A2FCC4_TRIV3|nr:hypothetical protein TVAGG3_0221670 [Trichomonas vaginalis G3]EAX97436.1 hypothetical protein TVAG_226800 [Trichomonas vaginalis G3]KAI5551994.1 hypothetical protein TVAGG3_0221670 [Trichomonas vaginalis G3]|eukprot:XP_001310366.1 hypothetical protein [Trichomonas vaginalis G3]
MKKVNVVIKLGNFNTIVYPVIEHKNVQVMSAPNTKNYPTVVTFKEMTPHKNDFYPLCGDLANSSGFPYEKYAARNIIQLLNDNLAFPFQTDYKPMEAMTFFLKYILEEIRREYRCNKQYTFVLDEISTVARERIIKCISYLRKYRSVRYIDSKIGISYYFLSHFEFGPERFKGIFIDSGATSTTAIVTTYQNKQIIECTTREVDFGGDIVSKYIIQKVIDKMKEVRSPALNEFIKKYHDNDKSTVQIFMNAANKTKQGMLSNQSCIFDDNCINVENAKTILTPDDLYKPKEWSDMLGKLDPLFDFIKENITDKDVIKCFEFIGGNSLCKPIEDHVINKIEKDFHQKKTSYLNTFDSSVLGVAEIIKNEDKFIEESSKLNETLFMRYNQNKFDLDSIDTYLNALQGIERTIKRMNFKFSKIDKSLKIEIDDDLIDEFGDFEDEDPQNAKKEYDKLCSEMKNQLDELFKKLDTFYGIDEYLMLEDPGRLDEFIIGHGLINESLSIAANERVTDSKTIIQYKIKYSGVENNNKNKKSFDQPEKHSSPRKTTYRHKRTKPK